MRKKGIKRTLAISRLHTQLHTWKRENRKAYNQIIGIAEMLGILTKRGTISTAKKNIKAYNQFIEQYQKEYGSYTSFMKKYSEKQQKIKKPVGMTKKQYAEKVHRLKEKLTNFFEQIYKTVSRETAIEYYDIAMTLDINEMEQFINDKIKQHRS